MPVSKRDFFNCNLERILIELFFFFIITNSAFSAPLKVEPYFPIQNAHVLRVSTTVMRLLGDPVFLADHPEYRTIAIKAKAALDVALTHDKAKSIVNSGYNKVLAENYGADYRSLSDLDPKKKLLKEAIIQLNEQDEIFWKKAMEGFSKNDKERKLLEHLVGAADYADVPMSRAVEFGGGKIREIEKASDWIQKLEHLSESERSGMKKVALYIEKHPDKFKDIYANINVKNIDKIGTSVYLKALKSNAKTIERTSQSVLSRLITTNSRIIGIAGMFITPGIVFFHYLKEPDFPTAVDEFVEITTATSELAKCETIGCEQVYKNCKEKKLSEEECLNDFFKKPLEEQTKLRLYDDLNLILKSKVPLITSLFCKKTGSQFSEIKISTINYNNEQQEQELIIDIDSKIQKIKVSRQFGEARPPDLIKFKNEEPQDLVLFQKPLKSKYSSNAADWSSLTIQKNGWEDQKMYFWTSRSVEQQAQIRRSQEALKSVRYQKSSILECCGSDKCMSFFSNLKTHTKHEQSKTAEVVHTLN